MSTTMKAKANPFRTLAVLTVGLVAVAVALFGVGLRSAQPQTATPKMLVQDLGTLGGSSSHAMGINDHGQVVGYSYTSAGEQHAFFYDAGASPNTPKMQDLGTLGGSSSLARSVNDSGQVVGYSYTSAGEQHAFFYDAGASPNTSKMQDLNTLIPADSGVWIIDEATAINNNGKIAANGPSYTWASVCQDLNPAYWGYYGSAFVLTPATTATPPSYEVQDLGTLGGVYSIATGINDSGQVVGESMTGNCYALHAFLYDARAAIPRMHDLGDLGSGLSIARSVNASGQVVGDSHISTYPVTANGQRAFLYDASAATPEMKNLGTLDDSSIDYHPDSGARGINDFGQVVGYSLTRSGYHGFLYDARAATPKMEDLNTLLPADSGWIIRDARAINTDGMIAATGHKDGVGTHALLLTPTTSDTPPPADDTQAPSPPTITSPPDKTTTSDGTPTMSGTAEANSTLTVYDGSTKLGTASADNSGSWTFTPSSALSDGEHSFTATATDAEGNTSSASNSVTITVDKTAPTVTSVSPISGARQVARSTSVTASFSEKMDPKTLVSIPTDPANPNEGTSTTFTLVKYGTTKSIDATVSYKDSAKTVTLTPSFNLEARTKYTVKLSGGVKDLASNALSDAPYTWSFTTGSQ